MQTIDTIKRYTDAKKIAGARVVVLEDGLVKIDHAAGYADIEAGQKTQHDTIFRWASITKTVVSVAALMLVERGLLNLTDPVSRYLPDFRPKLADGTSPDILIKHLLTHQAGLSYPMFEPDDSAYRSENIPIGTDQPGVGMRETLSRLGRCQLRYAPGCGWCYSMALDVLGAVLEVVADADLATVINDTLIVPLDMVDASFGIVDPSRLATPYCDGKDQVEPMDFDDHFVAFGNFGFRFSPARIFDNASFRSGGGGLSGTASDLQAFLEELRVGTRGVISDKVRSWVFTNQAGSTNIFIEGPGWGFSYGCAVQIEKRLTHRNLHNDGTIQWGGIWGNHWFIDPIAKLTFIQLTNTALAGMKGNFPDDVAASAYDDLV